MADTPHAENAPNDDEAARQAIASGARQAVRRAAELARDGAHPTLTALFCAGAAAPVIAAALSVGVLPAALLGALGGIGGNVLSNVVTDVIGRFRKQPKGDDPETLLAARLDELTAANDDTAEALRRDMARLLAETKAIPAAFEAIVKADREDLLSQLRNEIEVFAPLPEFRQALHDIHGTLMAHGLMLVGIRERQEQDAAQAQANAVRILATVQGLEVRINELLSAPQASGRVEDQPNPAAPYVGLRAFKSVDAAVFYGRERQSSRLLDHVSGTLEDGNLSMVIAASGAGKSSLLQAGFLPAVGYGFLQTPESSDWLGSERWPTVYMTPGTDPMWNLAKALAKHRNGVDASSIMDSLGPHPERADWHAEQALPDRPDGVRCRLVIVIDQFEELFTLTKSKTEAETEVERERGREREREKFMTAIAAMTAGGADAPALVVIGVRNDFLGQCGRYAPLSAAMERSAFLLTPMTIDEMRLAITGPAATMGLHLDEGLATIILDELRSSGESDEFSPAALPLLSTAMHLVYKEGKGRLTTAAYEKFGGVREALQKSAEQTFTELTPPQQRAAERLLRRMVRVSGARTLIRVPIQLDPKSPLDTDTQAALDAFVKARLVMRDQETVQIAHDALLTHWETLRTWLKDDLVGLEACSRLVADAKEWESKKDAAFLYQRSRLAAFDEHLAFWESTDQFEDDERATAEAFLLESRRVSTRKHRLRTAATAGIAGLSVIVLIASVIAVLQSRALSAQEAETLSKLLAEESRQAGETDGELARLLAAAAWEADETDEARLALTNSVGNYRSGFLETGSMSTVEKVEFSVDGAWLASANGENATIWDTETWSQRTLRTGMSGVADLSFNPDGSLLAIGGLNGVEIWETGSATLVKQLLLNVDQPSKVAFSADGTRIAAADDEGHFRVWETEGYTEIVTASTGRNIAELELTEPTGHLLMVTEPLDEDSDEAPTLDLWSAETGELVDSFAVEPSGFSENWSLDVVHSDPEQMLACDGGMCINSVFGTEDSWMKSGVGAPAALNTGGDLVASMSTDSIALWDPETRAQIALLHTEGTPTSLEFSVDGQTLAAGGSDGVRLWDLSRLTTQPSYQEYSPIRDVDISADGSRVLITNDELVQVWEPGSDEEPVDHVSWSGRASALSPDGSLAATPLSEQPSAEDHVIELWSPDGSVMTWLEGHTAEILAMEFSPDGSLLASAAGIWSTAGEGIDEMVRVWDVRTGQQLHELPGHGDGASEVAFNSDGTLLATLSQNAVVRVWDVATGALLSERHPGVYQVYDLEFINDTDEIALFRDSDITKWNAETGAETSVVAFDEGSYTPAGEVLLSGRYLAGMGEGYGIRIWDSESGDIAATLPTGSYDGLLAFAEDSLDLALSGEATWIFDLSFLEDPYGAACAQVQRSLDDEEREQYLGGYDLTPCE